ncbi:hypothetical protein ACFLRI_00755 [Bacteroidota bacterium]
MDKTKNIFGLLGFIIFLVAIFFKQLHLQGTNVLTILGSAIGCYYFFTIILNKEIKTLELCEKTNGVAVSITMITFLISFTFKRLNWAGGDYLLGISMLFFLILMLKVIISIFRGGNVVNKEILVMYKYSILYLAAVMVMFGMHSY